MRKLSLLMLACLMSFTAIYAADGDDQDASVKEEKNFKEKLKEAFSNKEEDDDEGEEAEEEKGFPLTLGLDLVSRYVWRGIDFGASPAIQPYMEYSVGNDLVTWGIGAWGSYAFTGPAASEADLYSYLSVGPVSLTFTDYFFPGEVWGGDQYFTYSNKKGTGHVYELMLSAGSDDFPVYGMAAVNLGGADKNYSTYFQLGATLHPGIDLFVGMAYDNYVGYYLAKGKQKFNVNSVGITASHDIEVKKLSIPLSASLIANPEARNIWFVVSIGLSN